VELGNDRHTGRHPHVSGVLDGKVAIVTGAGRGIGQAIAEGFAREGATVCCASRTAVEIEATVRSIEAAGGRAFAVTTDVADAEAVGRMLQTTVDRAGGLDILVANHGVSLDWKTIEHSNVDDWLRTFEVNLHGAYHCARLAIPHLKRRGGGNMIMVGSGQGHRGSPGVAAYACSKAALWMLVRVLADELRGDGISVNELLPGGVRTTLDRTRPRVDAPPTPRPPGDPIREPAEIVPLAIFLAAQPPSGPTGQTFSLRRQSL
jgi:3-oxoacyl-[acyl-carrier protein] reductase